MIRFLLILISFFAYTTFKAIQLAPAHPGLMLFLTLAFFLLIFGPMFLIRSKPQFFETKWFMALSWIGSTFIGFLGTFIILSIPIDIIKFIVSFFSNGESYFEQNTHLIVLGLSIIITVLGFIEVLRGPKIVKVDIPIADLSFALKDFKIIQISDLHIGPTIQTRYVERVVKKTNEESPDIIVITGDLVDAHTSSIKKHLQPLTNLKAKYGVYYVTGNHEYYWGVATLMPELQKLGFNILLNTNQVITHNGAKILISGVTDPMGRQFTPDHHPNLIQARTSHGVTDLNILLAHRPDPYKEAEELGFHLQFAGHTHAGQFFPFSLFIPFAHKYYRGLNRYQKMWLYVNPGTGYWGPANRFGIASEITLAKII